tara:strand:- start:389 stop:628 length:240 start_codon:yes stop_codon:yes gene_type:complete
MLGLNRFENKVIIVVIGLDPGCKSSIEYEGQRLAAISGTNLLPIRLQLGSLLFHAILEQGHGNSSLSNKRQHGPTILKL